MMSWKADMWLQRWICFVKAIYVVKDKYVAVKGKNMSYKVSVCCKRGVCAIRGDYVPWKANMSREMHVLYQCQKGQVWNIGIDMDS